MPNEETLGPRKTMVVLVIVVGCFAVLWPRILSPLVLGTAKDQLKPNQFDRDAGCCEVLFESEVAVLELLNEVCASSLQADGKLSPYAAAECRKTVNETCGVDIHAFLKRSDNVGKTTKVLLDTMKASNSSCLKEHFGVPVWSISTHPALNAWTQQDTLKQERPARLPGPHPALRERGRAIPVGVPPTPPPRPAPLPPHVRVRSSPLQGYFELEMQPPPIPGMRPPLGSPGGPVAAPKSSMGFVMPIYTICIIVFFVYTLSKILFKRSGGAPYEHVASDPQFRRRVFRDDSRSSPDKLVVTAISGLVAEVHQQMEASYANNQQRQDVQDNHARPYSNGTVIHSGPVQIVASEYREPSDAKEPSVDEREPSPEPEVLTIESEETAPEMDESGPEPKELTPEPSVELREPSVEPKEPTPEPNEALEAAQQEESPEQQTEESKDIDAVEELKKLTDNIDSLKDSVVTLTENLLNKEKENLRLEIEVKEGAEEKQSTPELLEEALREDSSTNDEEEKEEAGNENASVKVVGMEVSAHTADGRAWRGEGPPRAPPPPPPPRPHEAEQVQSIFLDAQIPQQSRVLVADFAGVAHAPPAARHAPTVVSGKMTLSLIQDAPRDTPDRDLESTLDEFTTASALTQPAGENEEDLSDEEVDEEIEVEEMEEEVEEVDEEVGEVEEEVEEVEEEAGEVEEKPREAAAKE